MVEKSTTTPMTSLPSNAPHRHVEIGNIATYEDASPEFLQRRKEDLRTGMRNPHLGVGEFVRYVGSRVAATAFVVGWGIWNGFENLVVRYAWVSDQLSRNHGQNHYVRNLDLFKLSLEETTQKIAGLVMARGIDKNGQPEAKQVLELVNDIVEHAHRFKLKGGLDEMLKLQEKFTAQIKSHGENAHLPGGEMCNELYETLKKINKANRHLGIGQNVTLWDEVTTIYDGKKGIYEGKPGLDPSMTKESLARGAILKKSEEVVEMAVHQDNRLIIDRYRLKLGMVPGAVAVAGLVAGVGSYRAALRDKALNQESELTHIERLERERRHTAMEKEHAATSGVSIN